MNRRRTLHTFALTAILVLANCGASDFASQLRLILAASGPLINSLNLGDKKAAVVQDFTDLGQGAATLADDLKACEASKPCKVEAISRFEQRFVEIEKRGHFNLSPKLQNIEDILSGVIQSAKIYYGSPAPRTSRAAGSGPVPAANPANELKAKLDELKAALKVN